MWYQLKIIDCPVDNIETLSGLLEEEGALSITLTDKNDEPVLEPEPGTTPLWREVLVCALFSTHRQAQQMQELLSLEEPSMKYIIERIEDIDWQKTCEEDFKPQCFGTKLWICPSWHTPPKPPAIYLTLDPGLAFGTGTHPTTSLCLTWLAKVPLQGKTLIDYGCGSGILSLAALKLGALRAKAIDIDPQALEATKANAQLNQIFADKLNISEPQSLKERTDLILANILLKPLLDLKEHFHSLLHANGQLVVSGLLVEQTQTLICEYDSLFKCVERQHKEDWGLLVFTPHNTNS